LVIFDGDGRAPATPAAGLPPGAAEAAALGDGVADSELVTGLGCLEHIEKFNARRKGRIVNRIIIKEVKALSAAAQKTSAFCMRSPENNPLADGIKMLRLGLPTESFC